MTSPHLQATSASLSPQPSSQTGLPRTSTFPSLGSRPPVSEVHFFQPIQLVEHLQETITYHQDIFVNKVYMSNLVNLEE